MGSAEGGKAAQTAPSSAGDPTPDELAAATPGMSLLELVQQEQASKSTPCDTALPDVELVCVRDPGHTGPHVGQQPDSTYVQWED